MLGYGIAFAKVWVNLRKVKIQIQPVTGFYLQHILYMSINLYRKILVIKPWAYTTSKEFFS